MEFWSRKLQGNIERDGNNVSKLHHLGWRVLVIWECETKNLDKLKHNLSEFLNAEGESHWTFFNGNYQEYEAEADTV